jgi:P2-related tail formation protein
VFDGDAQAFIHDHFGGALNVALVLEPFTVTHVRTETEQKSAASESGIFPEELTGELQGRAPVRIAHLVEFVLYTHRFSRSHPRLYLYVRDISMWRLSSRALSGTRSYVSKRLLPRRVVTSSSCGNGSPSIVYRTQSRSES